MNDLLRLLLQQPSEGEQTGLLATFILSFAVGVASVGAVYRLLVTDTARAQDPPRADRATMWDEARAYESPMSEQTPFRLAMMLIRYAFRRGNHD